MFFKQAFKGKNQWVRYISVSFLVFLGYQIGSLPLILAYWRTKDSNPALEDLSMNTFLTGSDGSNFDFNQNLLLTLLLISFIGALVAFYFIFKPFHEREFRTLSTPSSKIKWNKALFAFFVWLGFSMVLEGVSYMLDPGSYSLTFNIKLFIPLLLICLFILPIQTSFEELFFRGYMMQGFGLLRVGEIVALFISLLSTIIAYHLFNPSFIALLDNLMGDNLTSLGIVGLSSSLLWLIIGVNLFVLLRKVFQNAFSDKAHNYKILPLILTAILFGLVHSSNPEIEKYGYWTMQTYYCSAGLLLGIMTIMDDGLELALGTHAATNFAGAVFVGYDGAAINTDSILTSHALNPEFMTVGFIILAIIFLFVLKLKYKWGSFSKIWEPIIKPNENEELAVYKNNQV